VTTRASMCFMCIRVSKGALLQSDRHRMTTGESDPQGLGGEADTEPDQDNKYVKRTGSVKRSLQRVMPAIFQPTLPVTTRYTILVPCTIALEACLSCFPAPAVTCMRFVFGYDGLFKVCHGFKGCTSASCVPLQRL
jgi:hypothetical protein